MIFSENRYPLFRIMLQANEHSTPPPGTKTSGLVLPHQADIAAVAIGGMAPAVLVIIGHALIGERFHLLERTVALRLLQLKHANELVAAGIVHLVKLVASAEFGADRVPQKLHDLDALLVVDAVRAAHIFGEIFV